MTLHNYRSRQVHETSNGVNPSSGFRDMRSAKSGPNLCQFDKFLAFGQAHMGKWPWQCTTTGLDNSTELRTVKIHQAVTEIWVSQVWQPPGPWRQYPSSPEGWGVKNPHYIHILFFVWRRHDNISPYTGSSLNANHKQTTSWAGCQLLTGTPESQKHWFATHCCVQHATHSAMIHRLKQIGISCKVSHTGHNSKLILDRNGSLLGCLLTPDTGI